MCGIVGAIQVGDREPYRDLVQRAIDRMAHRGPDGQGFREFTVARDPAGHQARERLPASVLLGHRRLAIIDLSEGASQPMATPDGRFHLIFNGEIYNYREIGTQLKDLGHTFRTSSDAEVLLLGWQTWGTALLSRLIGMFSFAVLDQEKATVLLARDPFGIKPLYYAQGPEGLVFASEIAPLLDFPGVSRKADPQTVYEFLSGVLGERSGRTFFKDVRQVAAAHYLEVSCHSPGAAEPTCYWQLERKRAHSLSPKEASTRFRDLFEQSIKLHLRSDVPVGVSLSGGTDSSSITAMVRAVEGPEGPLHTFSYVADDPQLSEEKWCRIVVEATSAEPHWIRIPPGDVIEDFSRLIQVQEQPFGSPTIYAQYRIFRCAREAGIKVILSGQGADQYLGYIRHLSAQFSSLLRKGHPVRALHFLSHVRSLPLSGALTLRSVLADTLPEGWVQAIRRLRNVTPPGVNADWFRERGLGPAGTPRDGSHKNLHDLLKQNLLNTLPALLRFEDRNAMAFSVENRVPFLTTELVEFIFSLPEEEVISAEGRLKAVVLRAMHGLVPPEILERRDKIGFAMPIAKLNRQNENWLEGILSGAAAIPALHVSEIRKQSKRVLYHRTSDAESQRMLWRWLSLIAWAREFQVSFE